MRTLFSALSLCALLSSAMGAPAHEVSIEAVCFPAAGREFLSYQLSVPPDPRVRDRIHPDALRHIRTALSGRGLFEAPAGVAPDLLIDIACGDGAMRGEIRTRTTAVHPSDPLNSPFMSTGPVSLVTTHHRVYVSSKYLSLSARLAHLARDVWRVSASLSDETPGLEPALPILAAAIMNIIGRDTQGMMTLRLAPGDADVLFIQGGMKVAGN